MRAALLIMCVILIAVFAACHAAPQDDWVVSAYLDAFSQMDYDAMWVLCEPAVPIDEETFLKRYTDIFTGLGVKQITIGDISEPDEDGCHHYTATYHTKDFGDLTNTFSLKKAIQKGQDKIRWDYSLIFPEMDAGSSVRVRTLRASRGEIFAADGSLMAKNDYAQTLYMDISKVEDITQVIDVAEPITGLTSSQIIEKFNEAQEKGIQIVALGAFFELTGEQKQSALSVPGLGIDDQMYTPIRYYPLSEKTAHIVGYMGYAGEKDLSAGYTTSDKLGVMGLEAAYEQQMRGKDGRIVYIENRWGENIRTLFEQPMEQGQDLHLTIKPDMQCRAYDLMDTMLAEGEAGAAIVMDASTGFIEAMVPYPSFDSNLFTFGMPQQMWDYYNAPENGKPFNLRTTMVYTPGSVIKPFVAAAALQAGAVKTDTEFDGEIIDNKWTPDEENWHFPAITRVSDSGSPLKLENAMIHSDNIYFAYAALKVGEDELFDRLGQMGFDEAVPFDLPVESASLAKKTTFVTRKLLADMGYGQGEMQITPLQIAAMYTAFANGTGDMMEPVLVEKICRTEGIDYLTLLQRTATVWKSGAISGRTMDTLCPILGDVVRRGTGKPVRISGVGLAGKTGTAEIGNDKTREISWFAGYWTDGYYDRLVVVVLEVAAGEGEVKFDIAKALLSP